MCDIDLLAMSTAPGKFDADAAIDLLFCVVLTHNFGTAAANVQTRNSGSLVHERPLYCTPFQQSSLECL